MAEEEAQAFLAALVVLLVELELLTDQLAEPLVVELVVQAMELPALVALEVL